MAGRKQETALNWFPLDCDVFCNRKVKALRRAHGQIGLLAYINILCKIYAKGYYIKVADIKEFAYDIAEEIANDHLASVSLRVASAISYMADIGLLSKSCLDIGVLTGHAVQEQYITSMRKMKRTAQIEEYNVLDSDFDVQKNTIDSEEMSISSEEMAVDSETMTQTKQKETVVNYNTTSSFTRTREEWKALLEKQCDLDSLSDLCVNMYGNDDVQSLVLKTLLDLVTKCENVFVSGKEYGYGSICSAVEHMNRSSFCDIEQAFYEEDNVNRRWIRKKISNPTNYIVSILMSKE